MDNFLAMSAMEQTNVFAIDAHMGYGIHEHFKFPASRKDCVVYFTIVRPYVDILWSAMGHIKHSKKNITITDNVHNPWAFSGALSYQLCCFSDPQHHDGSTIHKGNLYTWQAANVRSGIFVPQNRTRANKCALRRLCSDIDMVASLSELDKLLNVLGEISQCPKMATPHANNNHLTMENETFDLLTRFLEKGNDDTALMKAGALMTSETTSLCN